MTTITFALTLWLTLSGEPVGAEVDPGALAEHYAAVERELRAADVGPLMSAFEVEREHLTRGLALISIGRYGGDEARAFLLDVLRTGKRSSRPWSALALGVLASESAQGRIDAAQALAVLEEREARATLAERLERDPCPTTRTAIAELLGRVGAPEDSERVAELLLEVRDPELEERLATALGRLGSRAALGRLAAWVDDEGRSEGLRSAAIEAAGFMLSQRPEGCLRELWRERNYAVTPAWFESLTVLTL